MESRTCPKPCFISILSEGYHGNKHTNAVIFANPFPSCVWATVFDDVEALVDFVFCLCSVKSWMLAERQEGCDSAHFHFDNCIILGK